MPPKCICLIGPTAAGKTDYALQLAEEFPIEIVSMDSAMVFRGMDIGTAKPTPGVRAQTPHHLIDILEPEQTYSAGRFAADASRCIAEIETRGNIALVVGGTLLYLRALRDGLADLPARNEDLRARIDQDAAQSGWAVMHARLAAVDPAAAARIEPADRQRIQRALEVFYLSGESLSGLQARSRDKPSLTLKGFALLPADREALKSQIRQRFDAMVNAGFVDEVRRLRQRSTLGPGHASMRAVGYRQIWRFLAGECDWPEARERALASTRQLAKRQLTWLRGDPGSEHLIAGSESALQQLRMAVAALIESPVHI
jgi:tRNA dimethylallyltransferase